MERETIKPMSFSAENFENREQQSSFQSSREEQHIDNSDEVVKSGKGFQNLFRGGLFFGSLFLLFSLYLLVDSVIFAREVFSLSPILGYTYMALWGVIIYYVSLFLYGQFEQYRSLKRVDKFRNGFQSSSGDEVFRYGFAMVDSYKNELGEDRVRRLKETLKTVDSQEVATLLSTSVLDQFDDKVEKIIFKYAKENGVVTALSQMALLDLIFLLWRNGRMVGEIASVYGYRAGFTGNLLLIKRVSEQLLFIGVTEIVENSAGALAGQTVASKLSSSVAQGIGHSILTVRIGISAMQVCRPIEEKRSRTELISRFLKDIGSSINPLNLFRK